MDHKINLTHIENQRLTMYLASATETKTNESKELRLIMENGKIRYEARYFKNEKLDATSKPLPSLKTAIEMYNNF